jgi:hypothetical protein
VHATLADDPAPAEGPFMRGNGPSKKLRKGPPLTPEMQNQMEKMFRDMMRDWPWDTGDRDQGTKT